jgi:hypothetical protein
MQPVQKRRVGESKEKTGPQRRYAGPVTDNAVEFAKAARELIRNLKRQHVRNLHKELSSVIHELVRRRQTDYWPGLAQIAVISDVYRCPRMNQVCDQEGSI